jgi:hypothetical protein
VLDQRDRQIVKQRLGLAQQVLAALEQRAARLPPHRQQLGLLVGTRGIA